MELISTASTKHDMFIYSIPWKKTGLRTTIQQSKLVEILKWATSICARDLNTNKQTKQKTPGNRRSEGELSNG